MSGDGPVTRAKDLFLDALEESEGNREAYIRRHCGDDDELHERVMALLRAHDDAGEFLAEEKRPTPSLPNDIGWDLKPGSRVGVYRLRETLGEGGFGTVFLAEQESPVVRQVALKVIKSGMDTRQVVARFQAERQALAMMDHPGIAKVLEAGATDNGRPYFVMEYVDGQTITAYCDRHRLSVAQRVELFEQVCHAVQHAHQKGVIHRDLKASNVLVTEVDGEARPKVIDFGIAKATGSQAGEHTLTGNHQIIGTPESMSPEQAATQDRDIDTRTDVYSLGVLLYHLLAGVSPYPMLRTAGTPLSDWVRVICNEDPLRPTVQLSQQPDGGRDLAELRQTTAKGLIRELTDELDWIVMRAMEKERSRRYPTAYALASDLRRHLQNEPVEAGPPTRLYRLRTLCRRHRTALTMFGGIAIALVVAAAISITFGIAATRAGHEAREHQKAAELALEESDRLRLEAERSSYIARVFAADARLEANDVPGARALLEATSPGLRRWEWNYLVGRLDRSEWTFSMGERSFSMDLHPTEPLGAFTGKDATVRVIDLTNGELLWEDPCPSPSERLRTSPVGENFYVGGEGGEITRYHWRTGRVASWTAHADVVSDFQFTTDGEFVLSSSWDGTIRVWDAATHALLRTIEAEQSNVHRILLSPDQETLASAGWDQSLKLWRFPDFVEFADVRGGRGDTRIVPPREWSEAKISTLEYLMDSRLLLAGTRDGRLTAWNWQTGELHWSDERSHDRVVIDIAVSRDGRRWAASSRDRTITLWDAPTFEKLTTLRRHDHESKSLSFSHDSRLLASASWDQSIRLWSATDGAWQTTLHGHEHGLYELRFTADDGQLITRSEDGTVRAWNLTEQFREALPGAQGYVRSVAFAPDDLLAVGDMGGPSRVWDTSNGEPVFELEHGDAVWSVAASADGQHFATGALPGSIQLWDALAGDRLATLTGHTDSVLFLEFSPDGTALLSGSWDSQAILWDVEARVAVHHLLHDDQVFGVTFDRTGTRILTVSKDRWLRVFDRESGALVRKMQTQPATWLTCLAVDPDNQHVAVGTKDCSLYLFDWRTGEQIREFKGHASPPTAVAWLPDGTRLVSGGEDRTVRLWDPETGENVGTLRGHAAMVTSVSINEDGTRIASGSEDRIVRVWVAP